MVRQAAEQQTVPKVVSGSYICIVCIDECKVCTIFRFPAPKVVQDVTVTGPTEGGPETGGCRLTVTTSAAGPSKRQLAEAVDKPVKYGLKIELTVNRLKVGS